MTNKTARTVYFSGIGGIGMSGLAQLLLDKGDRVVGSDIAPGPTIDLLKERGVEVLLQQSGEGITQDVNLVIFSAAVKEDNPEMIRARELNIPTVSYFEALGSVSQGKRTIAVAGTHGKTTTTGMLAKLLKDADAEPTAIVGSIVKDFKSNYLPGASDLFVVEACEYERHFLELSPEMLVVTNIEFDHSDYYNDLKDVQGAFRAFMEKVPAHGVIITDTEHPNIMPLLQGLQARVVDYTQEPSFELLIPGEFNQMNARAAAAAARAVIPALLPLEVNRSLSSFHGSWRRFEEKGRAKEGFQVFDDYAHHPTAIKETLRALKQRVKGKIFIAFHPHLYSRTRDLMDGFVRAFTDADEVLIAPIYAAREIDDGSVSNEMLAENIRAEGVSARAATFEEIENILRTEAGPDDVVMTMGAGDIYKVADRLVE